MAFLFQPHTSAGRVPTATAYRFFAQQVAAQATLSPEDEEWIRGEFAAASTAEEIAERAGHVLAEVSRGLGIVVSPPIAKTVLEHIRFALAAGWARCGGARLDGRKHPRQNHQTGASIQSARSRPQLPTTSIVITSGALSKRYAPIFPRAWRVNRSATIS